MNKNTGIIIGVIALVVMVGGIYASTSSKDDAMMAKDKMEQQVMEDQKMADEKMMMEKKAMEEKDAMIKKNETSMSDGGVNMNSIKIMGSYESYSPEKLVRAENGNVVLFFHASWCPSCRALNQNIEANITSIPAGVSILKVDYDKEVELKKKYGVTSQHTLVQVEKNGNMIKKWSGGSSLENLISKI